MFHDTLLDENAASHIAIGSGFSHLTEDEQVAQRINKSAVHTDFMIGSPEVEVTGVSREGRELPVLIDGRWGSRAAVAVSSRGDRLEMQKLPIKLEGPLLLAPLCTVTNAGFFLESYRRNVFEELEIDDLVQDNHSRSRRGIVRGMHFQPGQAKLVRCVRGAILDVIVDIRRGSPQLGAWEAFALDDKVSLRAGPDQLKAQMLNLLVDGGRRKVMGQAAIDYSRDCSFSRVADAYLDALGLC